ncbi:MAG: hypothetical protein RLZZ584_44 [Pseudomonadota bacterium]
MRVAIPAQIAMKIISSYISLMVLAMPTPIIAKDLFQYSLESNLGGEVCHHMEATLNRSFQDMWQLGEILDESAYSENGVFAFKRQDGIAPNSSIIQDLALSKWPDTNEFAAISWTEGRYLIADAQVGIDQPGNGPNPMLFAYFDFDNDGKIDTVLKTGFTPGYGPLHYGEDRHAEILWIIRGVQAHIPINVSKESLRRKYSGPDHEIILIDGAYVRPFQYNKKSYLLILTPIYLQQGIPDPTGKLLTFDVTINTYKYSGKFNKSPEKLPIWDQFTVCRLIARSFTK